MKTGMMFSKEHIIIWKIKKFKLRVAKVQEIW